MDVRIFVSFLFLDFFFLNASFLQDQCPEVILTTDVPFRRLDHYKIHEYTKKWNMNSRREPEPVMMTMTTNIDTMFKRKRGRPPKNRVIEVSLQLRFMERTKSYFQLVAFKLVSQKLICNPAQECVRHRHSTKVVGQISPLLPFWKL